MLRTHPGPEPDDEGLAASPGRRLSITDPAALDAAAEALAAGRLVLVPTETVYGIAARIDRPAAIAALMLAKGRPEGKPLQVLVASADEALALARNVSPAARALAEAFWPGPLTLVLSAGPALPAEVVAGDGTVGLRCPDHPDLRRLLERTGPLAASSANLSSDAPSTDCDSAVAVLGGAVALALDGPVAGGVPSSVVRVTCECLCVLRQGALSAAELEAAVARDV